MLDIQLKGSEDLRAMARALRRADREDLRRGLARAVKKAAEPTVEALRDAARKINTRGIGTPGAHDVRSTSGRSASRKNMRGQIAAAVGADIKVDEEDPRVRFAVKDSKLVESLKGMPRILDTPGDFRHPVFGNRQEWAAQTSDPWFFPPIKGHLDAFREEIGKELDAVRDKLEKGPL